MSTGTRDPRTKKRVLIVDDDELVRTTASEVFERIGLEVSTASNGEEAIVEMARNGADLAIVDVLMPDKEGIETLIQFKRDYPDTKVIMISSGGRRQVEDFLNIAQRFGADVVLKKPIKPSILLSHTTELLWGPSAIPTEPKWKDAK